MKVHIDIIQLYLLLKANLCVSMHAKTVVRQHIFLFDIIKPMRTTRKFEKHPCSSQLDRAEQLCEQKNNI